MSTRSLPVQQPEALDSSNEKLMDSKTLQQILDISFDELFVADHKGTIVYVNEACQRHYGLQVSELIGKSCSQLAEQGLWNPPVSPLVIKEKRQITMMQETSIGKKLLVTATPVFDDRGEVVLIVENTRDITALELMRQNLDKMVDVAKKYKTEAEEFRKRELDIGGFIVRSPKMETVLETAQSVAAVDSNVLILGESGSGKSFIAKYIHRISSRSGCPFISINCAAIPEQLFESELFGYSPGAFTGANKTGKVGLIELADSGTLFLDEIGEIPLRLQAKLLDVIEERQFIKVGGKGTKTINIRILAATNRDMEKCVKNGSFREDLYYRLNVMEIVIPPLRERTEEIVPIANSYLNKFDHKYGFSHSFSEDAINTLLAYHWPGNVRELAHVIERLVVTVKEPLLEGHDMPHLLSGKSDRDSGLPSSKLTQLDKTLELVERDLVTKAYIKLKSSYKVAKALGITQSKAYRLLRKYNCELGEEEP
jgi:PAS domain S-box-containing protein